jgi:sulfoxide reductase heme-binding subunit YedZ
VTVPGGGTDDASRQHRRTGALRRRAPRWLWLALSVPAIGWSVALWRGDSFYGEYVHRTGMLSLQLLIAAMAVTPLCRLWPGTGLVTWLRRHRRSLGVASFAYLLLHAGAYCVRQPVPRILSDAAEAAYASGWLAALAMAALALTSNDASVRRLGTRWKPLHRLVYAVAALTFAHWLLTAFDRGPAWIWLGVLLAIESVRLLARRPSPSA